MRSIPVLYYHRVGAPDPISVSVPTDLFRRQMEFLARRGYRSLTMAELRAHVEGRHPVKDKAVAITFDDGFRDNLQYAFPVLQQFRMKAAIFVCTGLLRAQGTTTEKLRPFNEAHLAARRGDHTDFLSAAELDELRRSGLVEVHSHSHLHRQMFYDEQITGVFPTTDSHWGIVSAYGDALTDMVWPVFRRRSGFLGPALIPDTSALRHYLETERAGTPDRAIDTEWFRRRLDAMRPFLRKESEVEFRARITEDLAVSHHRCTAWHDADTHALVWPWGSTSDASDEAARATGYNLAFLTATGANLPGTDSMHICRFPVKKPDLFRFAVGVWMRECPWMARLYGLLRGKV